MSAVRAMLAAPELADTLVVAGPTSVPLESEAGRNYLRARLALLAKFSLVLVGFFFVAGTVHRSIFLGNAYLPLTTAIHGGILGLHAFGWWLMTRPWRLSGRVLAAVDGALAIITLTAVVLQARLIGAHFHVSVDLVVALILFCILSVRAALIPSNARRSLVIGLFGVVPTMALAAWFGGLSERGLEAFTFSAIWCFAIVGITTFTSWVIFGLRRTAAIAKQLGQYVLEKKIGEGGMGSVFLAKHMLLRRPTAIKMLPPERAGHDTIARFEREVQETSRLSHPNTVAIYDYGRTPTGVFYYAMEYLEGADLERLVTQHGPMPANRVVHILSQIAGALSEAHGRGLVHRDMKPANVILCERGGVRDTVKVVDFGLVKSSEPKDPLQTDVSALLGTPAYISPEAIVSPEKVDARSDLYAVGAIGYWLLTGRRVFDANSVMAMCAAHVHEEPVTPSLWLRRSQKAPPQLESLILRCLAKDPKERPQSARELMAALAACDMDPWTADDADEWWGSHVIRSRTELDRLAQDQDDIATLSLTA
ncbi:MAG: serine/threonine-protein kinase [Labilithrix sp.]